MNTEKIKLKVSLPEKFSGGSKDNYEEFEKKLRTYLCLSDTRFAILLKWALTREDPITKEMITVEVNDDVQTNYTLTQMQPFLYYTLMSVLEGGAQLVIEQVSEGNGLEAYRLLHLRFANSKMQTANMRMATIVNVKFHVMRTLRLYARAGSMGFTSSTILLKNTTRRS